MHYLPFFLNALSEVNPFWLTSHLTDKPRINISQASSVPQSAGKGIGLEKKKNQKMEGEHELKDKTESFLNNVYFIFSTLWKGHNKDKPVMSGNTAVWTVSKIMSFQKNTKKDSWKYGQPCLKCKQ